MSPTGISWTDETWNPTVGCSRVSPGCDGCYAINVAHRALQPAHAGLTIKRPGERVDWTGEVRQLPDRLDTPLRWKRPRRVFIDSMSDLFHGGVDDLFLAEVFASMGVSPQHIFQVLTKRPKSMAAVLSDPDGEFRYKVSLSRRRLAQRHGDLEVPPWPLPNVWLGTSIESDRYTWRADHLRNTPAAIRFLSLEPLLGPLPSLDLTGIDWVIAGGESGPGARPMHPDWVRDIRDRCADLDIPFFFKQWGSWKWPAAPGDPMVTIDGRLIPAGQRIGMDHLSQPTFVCNVGAKAAGCELDGQQHHAFPEAR